MRRVLVALAFLAASPVFAAPQDHPALHQLFADEWERGLRDSPENASYQGDARFNDRWSDMSLQAIAKRDAADRDALARLHKIDRKTLSKIDKLNYDTFEWQLKQSVARQRFHEYLQPIGMSGGVQTLDGMVEVLPFSTEKDYKDWLVRLAALPALIDQNIILMQQGIKEGIMPPAVLMQRVSKQIARQAGAKPLESAFYKPFTKMPDSLSEAQKSALRSQAGRVIGEQVVPAYARLSKFFDSTYLPKSRNTIAASALPNGKAYYDLLASYYTTTDLSADAIHATGLAEVARIRARMEEVKNETGFKGTLEQFFTFLRSDPQFFHKNGADLLLSYQAMSKRIDPELVKVFSVLPRLTYGVRAIPDNIAPDTTTAYYQPAAADGTRAGFYYVNLYKPEVRPTWEMLALTLHEAVPGHHFQFARGLELDALPMFRKTAYFVAYGEGWGLYAEQLGYDMGLYDNPYDKFGQLTYEMWRAVRLVVDTGMHAKGWSRQQAIDYFKANAPKTEQDIVNEIDRYIGWPGQALAYKIGQLKISELRKRASTALGPRFDLRAFHDEILGTGSIPLGALETHIDAWIARQRAK
ncbi:DUF885 family protein [Massilia sp. CF038]|uniref:DUF885 domain-containing protein n=1 Tax=Massilia sp. CF038 TaxID=1881045 RepID=UPI00091F20BF|nr:DUF885 domain-containing protein [Massilia sp. CF038]SHH19567.1 Uncharacterized conserved protein, DUF885 familyt [Massilia sp. CF038]